MPVGGMSAVREDESGKVPSLGVWDTGSMEVSVSEMGQMG